MRNKIIPDVMPILIVGSLLVVTPVIVGCSLWGCDYRGRTCFGVNWGIVTEKYVQDWLKRQDNVNTVNDSYGTTSLYWAARWNDNPAIITALLNAGAQVNVKNKYGDTPLHWAADNDNPAIITALIKAGAKVSAKGGYGYTPLHLAAARWNDNLAIITVLLNAGAEVSAKDIYGRTPLHIAAGWYNDNPAIITALLNAGAQVNAKDNNGNTPLDVAKHRKNRINKRAIVRLLENQSTHRQ